jgi:polyferredoxin
MLVSQIILLGVSMVISADLIFYFVSPYDVIRDAVAGSVGPWTFWSWVVFSSMIYVNLAFVGQKFCASACPYPRVESAFLDKRNAEVHPRGMRRRVLWLSACFALIAVMFAYQVFIRMPMDLWVMRDEAQEYHQVGVQGTLMNAYSVVVENRGFDAASYRLSVSGVKDAELVLAQNPFSLPGNSLVRLKVYVIARRKNIIERVTRLHFILENTGSKEMRIIQEAPFVFPERSEKGVEI